MHTSVLFTAIIGSIVCVIPLHAMKVRDFSQDATDLLATAKEGDTATCRELIKKGDSVHVYENGGYCNTPLHLAVEKGHLETCGALMEEGAELEVEKL